jgi:hypothetical protein
MSARLAVLAALKHQRQAEALALVEARILRICYFMEHPSAHTLSAALLREFLMTLEAERTRLLADQQEEAP